VAVTGKARRRLAAVAVAWATLASTVAACDGDQVSMSGDIADRRAVAHAVRLVQRAFAAGDRERLCALMDATARRQAGLVAHGTQDRCPQDRQEAFVVIDAEGGMRAQRDARHVASTVTRDAATATVELGAHGRVNVPLTRSAGGWRLGSFFGTAERAARASMTADRPSPLPLAGGEVVVTDGHGYPCLPLFDDDYPQVGGGCELRAIARRMRLTIGTVLGRFEFGHCEIGYRVMTDERGRTWTDSVVVSGPDNTNNGCSDVRACATAGGEQLPWRGRISATRGGRFAHRMSVCLDTCIGFYAGPLTVGLSKRVGWHAIAANAGIGLSGLRMDGRAALDANAGLVITARR
jgi:hypothetical protein